MPKTYKIGTRGSLLALTQAGQIKDQLEALGPDRFELKIIKTQGDQLTDRPLWQLEGKDFFTRELDHALLAGEIDLVVHSYKDLGGERPQGIETHAITQRFYGHDVLLMRKELLDQTPSEWVIGTSSPRRMTNLKHGLGYHLPHTNGSPRPIRIEMLRGNVNTRIEKCLRGDFHGIVLALAGLERLAQTESSREVLANLLQDMTFMVLPPSSYPWSAAQGALAIEALTNSAAKELIQKLHHAQTAREVGLEKERFRTFGGGCHLAVGIAVRELTHGLTLVNTKGEQNESQIDETQLLREESFTFQSSSGPIFIGLPPERFQTSSLIGDELFQKTKATAPEHSPASEQAQWFATHPLTLHVLKQLKRPGDLVWAAGDKTHRHLAAQGHWVHGNADSLGEGELKILLESKALGLMAPMDAPWFSLTHRDGSSQLGQVVEGYVRSARSVTQEFEQSFSKAQAYYWTSFSQFLAYQKHLTLNPEAQHFCGLGKTWRKFQDAGITVTPMPSVKSFLQAIGFQEPEL